jgi:2-oxoglutarate ferredoxin oxidoreductase subunit alpha
VSFREDPKGFLPYLRDEQTLSRPWARPGTPGLEHRIGGLEKSADSGNISYDPDNHHKMTKLRAAKVAGIAQHIPEQELAWGAPGADLAVVSWGGTFGTVNQAVRNCARAGLSVAHVHLRYLNPLPRNLGTLLGGFRRVLVPELNNGMLVKILRSEFLLPAVAYDKIAGKPFKVSELESEIRRNLQEAN